MSIKSQRSDEPFDAHENEESYFALQEHELVEQMKSEHQKAEAVKRQTLAQMCPKCPGKFTKYAVKGFEVERCDTCEGIWLTKGALAEILRRQAAGPLGTFLERCFARVK